MPPNANDAKFAIEPCGVVPRACRLNNGKSHWLGCATHQRPRFLSRCPSAFLMRSGIVFQTLNSGLEHMQNNAPEIDAVERIEGQLVDDTSVFFAPAATDLIDLLIAQHDAVRKRIEAMSTLVAEPGNATAIAYPSNTFGEAGEVVCRLVFSELFTYYLVTQLRPAI